MFRIACHTTYTQARENFAELWDKAIEDREIIIINRKNHEDVALIAASELSGLLETAHLLRSHKNARRLLTAILRAQTDEGEIQTIDDLKREVGLA